MAEIFGVDGVFLLLLLASLVLALWALIDAASQPKGAFQRAGQSKVLWIILPIIGLVLFFIVGGILGIVYLATVRPKVRAQEAIPTNYATPASPGWWMASDGDWYPPESAPPRDGR